MAIIIRDFFLHPSVTLIKTFHSISMYIPYWNLKFLHVMVKFTISKQFHFKHSFLDAIISAAYIFPVKFTGCVLIFFWRVVFIDLFLYNSYYSETANTMIYVWMFITVIHTSIQWKMHTTLNIWVYVYHQQKAALNNIDKQIITMYRPKTPAYAMFIKNIKRFMLNTRINK